MTQPSVQQQSAALAPVRVALLARAHADAAATEAAAEAAVAAALAEAGARADRLRAEARAVGERDAAVLRARQRAHGRREARAIVLAAEESAYRRLRDRARDAVRSLRSDPGYPALLDVLRERVLAELGPEATVREHPDGGLVAEVPGRRLDASLPALADEALDALGGEVEGLWRP